MYLDGLHLSSYFQVLKSLYLIWWLYRGCKLQLVSASFSCSMGFFLLSSKVNVLISLFVSSSFTQWSAGTAKSTIRQVLFFFCWLSQDLVVWPRLDDSFVSQNPNQFCASHFLGRIIIIIIIIMIIIIIIIIIYTLRVFHIGVSWWSFTEVWVTASILKSPGLFSVFWPTSVM